MRKGLSCSPSTSCLKAAADSPTQGRNRSVSPSWQSASSASCCHSGAVHATAMARRMPNRQSRAGAGTRPSAERMNYRHAFHAGNFADAVKHAVLARLVEYLKLKDKAFRVIDTHAGTGLYDLSSEQAQKTGEWQGGIARLLEKPLAGRCLSIAAALSWRRRGRQSCRSAYPLSRFAADRPAPSAQAGPADRYRTAPR